MLYIYSTIFVIGALLIRSETATLHCSHQINQSVQRCVQPVAQYARVLNQQDGQNSSNVVKNDFGQAITLPKIGRYVFRELCRLIREFNDCVYDLRHQCPKHVTVTLIDASYGFLCNEGYETFMSSAECLMELDQQPTVKQCHEITLKHIEAANKPLGITTPSRFENMCQALNYFSSCVERPIAHSCGGAAWSVIFRVLRDTTNTLLPGCKFTGHSEPLALPPPLRDAFLQTAPFTTTPTGRRDQEDFPRHKGMLNDKAEIVWSDEDVTTSRVAISDSEIEKIFGGGLKPAHDADPRRNILSSQGQSSAIGSSSRHVFIDRDTDINYYDGGGNGNNAIETVSSSSFFAVNLANHCYAMTKFVHFLLVTVFSFNFYLLIY